MSDVCLSVCHTSFVFRFFLNIFVYGVFVYMCSLLFIVLCVLYRICALYIVRNSSICICVCLVYCKMYVCTCYLANESNSDSDLSLEFLGFLYYSRFKCCFIFAKVTIIDKQNPLEIMIKVIVCSFKSKWTSEVMGRMSQMFQSMRWGRICGSFG